ncbi:4'-phosphopantetheinyl transferase superfamily protein [bacterium]|nr:4'-phosphopantetheinyl transferase superfamily protein [bacterium]
MTFQNPFPESCCFAVDKKGILLTGVHPLEIQIGNAFLSASRRAEFFSGRRCAHTAMKMAGYPGLPILREVDRSPLWPLNVLGSITHGAALAAAIIRKPHQRIIGLGIDIEDLSRDIRSDINRYTLTRNEMEHWSVDAGQLSREARIIFSIKETIYKCFFPVNRIPLGFQDAEVTKITDTGFQAQLLKNPFSHPVKTPIPLQGVLQVDNDIVFCALQEGDRFFLPSEDYSINTGR